MTINSEAKSEVFTLGNVTQNSVRKRMPAEEYEPVQRTTLVRDEWHLLADRET